MGGTSFILNHLKKPIWHTLDKFCPHIFTNCSPFIDDCFFQHLCVAYFGHKRGEPIFPKYFQLGFDPENRWASQLLLYCLI